MEGSRAAVHASPDRLFSEVICAIAHGFSDGREERKVSGGHSGGVTPVPIPNTEVKPASADGTWGEAPWESRSPPECFSDTAPRVLAWGCVALRRGTARPRPRSHAASQRPRLACQQALVRHDSPIRSGLARISGVRRYRSEPARVLESSASRFQAGESFTDSALVSCPTSITPG